MWKVYYNPWTNSSSLKSDINIAVKLCIKIEIWEPIQKSDSAPGRIFYNKKVGYIKTDSKESNKKSKFYIFRTMVLDHKLLDQSKKDSD